MFDVRENQSLARRLVARDTDPGDEVTGWEIVGGVDQGQFTITTDTGELSFRTAPDFEAPGDNEYEVRVEVRSGTGARELEAEQTFTVRVTDEREPPGVPDAPTFSGETADSLRVSWREPDNTGPPITDYDVQYREGGSGGFTDAQHEGPGLALTLSGPQSGNRLRGAGAGDERGRDGRLVRVWRGDDRHAADGSNDAVTAAAGGGPVHDEVQLLRGGEGLHQR